MTKNIFAFLFLIAASGQAEAASRVWISEFVAAKVTAPAPFATIPAQLNQPAIDISAGTAKRSAIFSSQTKYIRIVCEVQCAISAGGIATANDILLPALKPEYFGVAPGGSITVIVAP